MSKSIYLQLVRYHQGADAIDGYLSIKGKRVCDCCEQAATALAPGSYTLHLIHCPFYKRQMISFNAYCQHCHQPDFIGLNTPTPRYCPQIKPGNGVHNRTDGSIIVGERLHPGAIRHPNQHFNRLIDRLDKAVRQQKEIQLTIKSVS